MLISKFEQIDLKIVSFAVNILIVGRPWCRKNREVILTTKATIAATITAANVVTRIKATPFYALTALSI